MGANALQVMELVDWKKDAKRSSKVVLRKHAPAVAVLRADDSSSKSIPFVISDSSVDRDNDTVDVKGWDLSRYNGVILFGHCSWEPSIGKSTVKIDGEKLLADATFVSRDLYDFGGMIGDMVRGGFMRSASVGFRPTEWEISDDREPTSRWSDPIDFKAQELLEWSVVTIPSNPNAHALSAAISAAKSAGLDVGPALGWAERLLSHAKGAGSWITRQDAETIAKTLGGNRVHVEIRSADAITTKADESGEVVTMSNHLENLKGVIASMKEMQVGHANAMADMHAKMGQLHEQMKATQGMLAETQEKLAAYASTEMGDDGKSGDVVIGKGVHALSGEQYKRVKGIRKAANAVLAAHHADDGDEEGDGGAPAAGEPSDSGKSLVETPELTAEQIAAELGKRFQSGGESIRDSIDRKLNDARSNLLGKPT